MLQYNINKLWMYFKLGEIIKKLSIELKVIGYEYIGDTLIINIEGCKN